MDVFVSPARVPPWEAQSVPGYDLSLQRLTAGGVVLHGASRVGFSTTSSEQLSRVRRIPQVDLEEREVGCRNPFGNLRETCSDLTLELAVNR